MQDRTANGKAATVPRKFSIGRQRSAYKANAAEGMSLSQGQVNPETFQSGTPVRHQAFATGLVNWWLRAVRH